MTLSLLSIQKLTNDQIVMFYLVAGITLIAIAVKGYDIFLQCDNVHVLNSKLWFSKAGYTPNDFAWFTFATFCLPTGFVCGLIFLVQFAKGKFDIWTKYFILYTLLGLTLWSILESHALASETLSCGVFCFGKVSQTPTATMTAAEGFVGMTYLAFCLFYLLALVYTLISLHKKHVLDFYSRKKDMESMMTNIIIGNDVSICHSLGVEGGGGGVMSQEGKSPVQINDNNSLQTNKSVHDKKASTKNLSVLRQFVVLILCFIVLFPFLFLCTMALPTSWKSMSLLRIRTFQASVPDPKVGFYWKVTVNTDLVLKIYPDVLFYYGFIYFVLVMTILSNYIKSIKNLLRSRVKLYPLCTFGEALMMTMLTGLVIGEFYYYYAYVPVIAKSTKTPAEQGAVAVGQTASIVMGLLLLPITRNSIWSVLFGISPNSLVKFHEVLGYVFVILSVIHTLLFWKVFDENQAFPADVFGVPMVTHANNITTPLLELGVIVMFICIVFPSVLPSFRRVYFEAFYYLHHFFIILFLMVLWHATRSWYFVTASFILWVADHALRLMNCIGTEVEVVSLNVSSNGSVVELTYQNVLKWHSLGTVHVHQPGQYMYLNIPSISTLQWHPFTISSSTSSSTSHTIKSKGEKQWTGKLIQLAMNMKNNKTYGTTPSSSASSLSEYSLKDIVVIVDGPYGAPLSFSEYSHVLLVAGGIGITPYASLLNSICNERAERQQNESIVISSEDSSSCCTYRLIWIVKCLCDIEAFDELIYRCNTFGIEVCVYLTKDDTVNEKSLPVITAVHRGRPDLQLEIGKLESFKQQAMVAVCGPPSLVDACCRLSTAVSFQSDLFEY
eukprot:gene3178-6273_t